MLGFIYKSIANIFGTQNERELKKMDPLVQETNSLEEEFSSLSDDGIKEKVSAISEEIKLKKKEQNEEIAKIRQLIVTSSSDTDRNKHKKRLKDLKNSLLDEYIAPIFAAVREASRRTIGLRHFDVQLVGGIVLHHGKIAEMTTGEGKTLVATLPASLNALAGENVHVITVNDYLAKRDSEWMGPIYKFLGLSVGVIQNDMRPEERKKSYACDIVYGTNNEFGFDYLRDNMVVDKEDIVQREADFSIVDEVDSILVDEARTPLIISGPVDETNESYNEMRPIVQQVVSAQGKLIREYLTIFNDKLKEGNEDEAGKLLYLIHKGDPKNREFMDMIMKDRQIKSIFDKTQALYNGKIMEKERHALLEDLYFVFDEKTREVTFSTRGQELMRKNFNIEFMLEDIENTLAELSDKEMPEEEKMSKETELISSFAEKQKKVDSINQLIKAYKLFQKDVHYVINENKIVIVDEFTGRMMPGRRFSDGIHEAIEAKESVEVQRESQTLATITLQNYFRMYDKLAGMTGTAKTEEPEFVSIYLLPVVQIPTNKPLARANMSDRIYKTSKEKFNASIDEIEELNKKGRPILVGTISIEKSEKLSKLLSDRGIPHNVLNAKYHEKEAHIISQAGRLGAVTIATNMAGRGTDILLGGNPEALANDAVEKLDIEQPSEKEKALVKYIEEYKVQTQEEKEKVLQLGGLHILGTERHEARRIDDQLRGRAGRQGDPGSSRFYLSLEDDLMRIFGSDRIKTIMDHLGMEEGEVIENPLVTRAVRTAQHRVESQNFEVRKHLLKYDNVMNQQREVIYRRRNMVLTSDDLKKEFLECFAVGLESILDGWEDMPEEDKVRRALIQNYAISVKKDSFIGKRANEIIEEITLAAEKNYSAREKFIGKDRMRELEKMVMLSVIDSNWKEYLREIDELREGISWRAYAQKDPLIEFQHEAFQMFTGLMIKIDEQVSERIMKISAMEEQYKKGVFQPEKETFEHKDYSLLGDPSAGQDEVYDHGSSMENLTDPVGGHSKETTFKRDEAKVGRNDPCPCGSGKKYKKCCGK